MTIKKILEDIEIINEVTNDLNNIVERSIVYGLIFTITMSPICLLFGLSDLFLSFIMTLFFGFIGYAAGMVTFLPDLQKKYFKILKNNCLYLDNEQKLYNPVKLKKITKKLENLSSSGKTFLISEDNSKKLKVYDKKSLFIKMIKHSYLENMNSINALDLLLEFNIEISKELKENEKSNLLYSLIINAIDIVGRDNFFKSKNELINMIEKDLLIENQQIKLLNMIEDKIKLYESESHIEIQNKFKKLKEKKDIDILNEAKKLIIKSI